MTRVGLSRYWYDMGSTRIVVASGGTLTVDTDEAVGALVFGSLAENLNYIDVQSGGTLSVGVDGRQGTLLWFGRGLGSQSWREAQQDILVRSGGTWNWYGGIIDCNNAVWALDGSSLNVSGTAQFLSNTTPSAFRFSGVDTNISQLLLNNASIVWFSVPNDDLTGISFENIQNQCFVGLGIANTFIDLRGFDISDASIDRGYGFWDDRWARLINHADGTDLIAQGNLDDDARNRGLLEVRQEIEFSATNGSGAKFYTKDTNNGSRLGANQINSNPSYIADRTYTLTESGGSATTTGNGVLTGVYWRSVGGAFDANNRFDSRGINGDTSDVFQWLKVERGQQPATANIVMRGTTAVQAEIQSLPDLADTGSDTSGLPVSFDYAGGTLTATVTGTMTLNQLHEAVCQAQVDNPAWVWDNGKVAFSATANGLDYTHTNLAVEVDGGSLTGSAGQTLPAQPTVTNGGFFEDANGAIWEDGGATYFASHAWFEVRDTDTSLPIPGAVIGFGDVPTQTRLLYNTARQLDTLVTDAQGRAEGYMVYQVDATTYADMKQVVGEYDHVFATIPRALSGAPIGSAANPEVTRLSPDTQVTLAKAAAGAVTGVSWDVPADTITTDENLPTTFDSLKYQMTADADISPGIPGCMAFCLYGLPIDKSGSRYTARSGLTVYVGIQALAGTFAGGAVVFDTPGSSLGSWDGNTWRFETAGTYDFRSAAVAGTVTLENTSGGAVTVRLAPAASFVNNGPDITVEASVACPIVAADMADGTRVQLYNVTQGVEIENTVVSGGAGYSYIGTLGVGLEFENGDQVRLRATRLGYGEYEAQAQASANGIGFLGAPSVDPVYTAYGIDGSTVTTFAADYVDDEVDIVVAENFSGEDFWAWWNWNRTTEQGIREFFGAVRAIDEGNIEINSDVLGVRFDNLTGAHVWQTDPIRIFRKDGQRPVKDPTTGGGGVDPHWLGNVFVSTLVLSGQNVITGDIADVPARVQTGLTAQGYTAARAASLDHLDADVSSRATPGDIPDTSGLATSAEIAALNDIEAGDVVAAMQAVADDFKGEAGLTPEQAAQLEEIAKLTGNKVTADGDDITIYEDDGVTVWRRYSLAGGGRVQQ